MLEADRHLVAESVLNRSNLFTSEEVSNFFDTYTDSFQRAKRVADRNLKRFTSKRARSHTTCWDVIKRLRRADGTVFNLTFPCQPASFPYHASDVNFSLNDLYVQRALCRFHRRP
jgi:hypothetical protein